MSNLLSSLKVDNWFQALIYLGGSLTLASIFTPVYLFTNEEVFVLGLSIFLIGVGKWMPSIQFLEDDNHSKKFFKKIWSKFKDKNKIGLSFILVGFILLVYITQKIILKYFT